jgi:hypothetical protein
MAASHIEARIREARLIVMQPEQVLIELEQYANEHKDSLFAWDKQLENSLLARDNPLINLGLARNAGDKKVLAALYAKSMAATSDPLQERYLRGLRIACLSNEVAGFDFSTFTEGVLGYDERARLISEGDGEELGALLSNPRIGDEMIETLFMNTGIFASIPEERRRLLISLSVYNPRLVTEEDSEGGPDLGYRSIHRAILALLGSAPTTEDWLITLWRLLDNLDSGNVCVPDDPITSILDRWAKVRFPEDALFKDGHFTQLSSTDEFRCLLAAMYGHHSIRDKGGKFSGMSNIGSKDSADVAFRCAYYGKGTLKERDMREGFEKNEMVYLLAVLCNESVYSTPALRSLLEDHQLGGDVRFRYLRHCNLIHKRRPSFDP